MSAASLTLGADHGVPPRATSPFGADADWIATLRTAQIADMYRRKCGVDITSCFGDLPEIHLFECTATGMRFWRPREIAGDEGFYRLLNEHWPTYYQTSRWEYPQVHQVLKATYRVLEIGSGRGYFLQSIESKVGGAMGLELNREAIAQKETRFPIESRTLESVAAAEPERFDVVCSFQVLEHVTDPAGFMRAASDCLKPAGLLIVSTPNYDHPLRLNRQDAFDLPPHHLNHFNASSYRRIADRLGLELVKILEQPNVPWRLRNWDRLSSARLWRLLGRRGDNLLTVLRKPAK